MKTLSALAAAWSLMLACSAQTPANPAPGSLASVQSALKEQQFYFGEITGKLDAETRSALRRFQIHRGLAVTGELDAATQKTLQTAGGESETRSVRALAQETVQEDQQFLQRLESTAPVEPAPREQPQTAPPAPPTPPKRTVERTEPAPSAEPISKAEATRFVRAYLDAAEEAQPDREISFYADQVNYFVSGTVSRKFIEKDQRNYYRRWPARKFTLIEAPDVSAAGEDRASVRFKIRYALRGAGEAAQGETENILQVRKTGSELKIASIRERKIQR
jgi:hypothetical protein